MNRLYLDIGYGYTKSITNNRPEHAVSFPSALAKVGGLVGQEKNKRAILQMAEREYYFGTDALRFSRMPIVTRDRNRPDFFLRFLVLGCLSEHKLISGKIEVLTALPVEWVQDAQELKDVLLYDYHGRRLDTKFSCDVVVENVRVFPQPMATFFYWASMSQSMWDDGHVTLIVDIGTGTYNLAVVESGRWVDDMSTSQPHGMGEVVDRALSIQESQAGARDRLHIARNRLWNDDEEMLRHAERPAAVLGAEINQAIASTISNTRVDEIILSGGGTKFVEKHIREQYGDKFPILKSADPQLNVVRGLATI